MINWIAAFLLVAGALFSLLAAVGILRMPDLFNRMHTSTKSGTMGVGCILIAVAIYSRDPGIAWIAMFIFAFFLLTAPVAAHMIARAAYFTGVPLWKKSVMDDLSARKKDHPLDSEK